MFQTSGVNEEYCQDRYGILDKGSFNRRSCTMCYFFLFHGDSEFKPHAHTMEYLESKNASRSTSRRLIAPDVKNATAMAIVCSTLDEQECARWTECCTAAFDCCQSQVVNQHTPSFLCPATWDGYSCWGDTHPGQEVTKACPDYVGYAVNSRSKYQI